MRNLTSDRAYQRALAQYLTSPIGRDTPMQIAERLKKLDPESVGIGVAPNLAQLHNTRIALEYFANEAAQYNLCSREPRLLVAPAHACRS